MKRWAPVLAAVGLLAAACGSGEQLGPANHQPE